MATWAFARTRRHCSALDGVQELNERCLNLLQRLAGGNLGKLPRFLTPLAQQLELLDPAGISSAARQPFLLIDFSLGNPARFREMLARATGLTPRFAPSLDDLPALDATALARGTLILAQTICRHHPAHAGLLLGLHSSLIAPVAKLRLPDLERMAEFYPCSVRLRWDRRISVWRYLLEASASQDPVVQEQFRMYGIRLMAAAAVPAAR